MMDKSAQNRAVLRVLQFQEEPGISGKWLFGAFWHCLSGVFDQRSGMKKILIIEDDAITARVYESLLARGGYKVRVAGSIGAGFEQVSQFGPDGILLDLRLPDSNGLEFLKKLRATKGGESLPVIVYTNVFVPGMIESAVATGATRVFDKATITPSMILDTFGGFLRDKDQAAAA